MSMIRLAARKTENFSEIIDIRALVLNELVLLVSGNVDVVSISLNGKSLVEKQLAVPLAPKTSWRVGVGASTHKVDAAIEVLGLEITVQDAFPFPVFSLSPNGEQADSASQANVHFAALPHLSRIALEVEPFSGGALLRVLGSELMGADRYQCHCGTDISV